MSKCSSPNSMVDFRKGISIHDITAVSLSGTKKAAMAEKGIIGENHFFHLMIRNYHYSKWQGNHAYRNPMQC